MYNLYKQRSMKPTVTGTDDTDGGEQEMNKGFEKERERESEGMITELQKKK